MSDIDNAIEIKNLSKHFILPHQKANTIKSFFINPFSRYKNEKQTAFKDISFNIKKGEFFGIVGRNGSGKSTLLKCIAGVYSHDTGSIRVNGKLVPFIELGVGFNDELSGRDNVFLNGALLGFNRKEMEAMYDDIVEFAELERFMDQKLSNYSSGMHVRLAFSIAIRAKSDILLLDEVLAVGDSAFQSKCFDYFQSLKNQGTTVVFVSHDINALERFCTSGVLINDSKIIERGSIKKVLKAYNKVILSQLDKNTKIDTKKQENTKKEQGSAKIIKTEILDTKTKTPKTKFATGESSIVRFTVETEKQLEDPIFGITVWEKTTNKPIFANNTILSGHGSTGIFKKGVKVVFELELPSNLNNGEYTIEPAVANASATVFFDRIPEAKKFYINGGGNPYAIVVEDKKIHLEQLK